MKRTVVLFIFAVVFASALVAGLLFRGGNAGLVRSVQAKEKEEGCTLETLQGEYLFTGGAQANINQRDNPTYPRVFAGVVTFDGAGNISGLETRSRGGQINRRITFAGTYTLDSDCTGTVAGDSTNWDMFVNRDGSEGNLIRYDDGAIATRSFKKR